MKIAITDYSFPNLEIEEGILVAAGHELSAWKEKRPSAEFVELVHDADAVITQFASINAEVIASMQRAKVHTVYLSRYWFDHNQRCRAGFVPA